jgi:hypothetical protein
VPAFTYHVLPLGNCITTSKLYSLLHYNQTMFIDSLLRAYVSVVVIVKNSTIFRQHRQKLTTSCLLPGLTLENI